MFSNPALIGAYATAIVSVLGAILAIVKAMQANKKSTAASAAVKAHTDQGSEVKSLYDCYTEMVRHNGISTRMKP